MNVRVHTVAGDHAGETVYNSLLTLIACSPNSFSLNRLDVSQTNFSFPNEGILIVSFESLKSLPDNKHFPPALHVVHMSSWDDLVQCAERIAQIVELDSSVEKSRKDLPWFIRHHGLSFDEVYDVDNRRAEFVLRFAHI